MTPSFLRDGPTTTIFEFISRGPIFHFGVPPDDAPMPLLHSGTQRNHKDFSSDVPSNAVLVWHQMQNFFGRIFKAASTAETLFRKITFKTICFTFCDPLRLERQCSLSRHRRRFCSRRFRAGRSCLLPAICTPQGRTGAEGFPTFSGGQRSPRNRARSWSRNFTKSGPKFSRNLHRSSPEKFGPVFYSTKLRCLELRFAGSDSNLTLKLCRGSGQIFFGADFTVNFASESACLVPVEHPEQARAEAKTNCNA